MKSVIVGGLRACILLIQFFVIASARKTEDMIYTDITGISACIRRFNATHQIGCSSNFHGNTGVIHYMANAADVEWVVSDGPHEPYVALMEPEAFTLVNVNRLAESGKVTGIMVINVNSSVALEDNFYFSPDRKCPSDNFGAYSTDEASDYAHCKSVEWNPNGNEMNFMDLKLPVLALLNENEVEYLRQCYMDHNEPIGGEPREYPLCAVELHDFMFGAKDTPTCMRRTKQTTNLEMSYFCDPLGDFNIWATLKPTNKSKPLSKKSLIVAAAQIDSTSMFMNVVPQSGAEQAASSYITLLAVVQTLGALSRTVRDEMSDIMFVFFEGESYDYIGSSRMVYDMVNGSFPYQPDGAKTQPAFVGLEDIGYFLELKQLGLARNSKIYAHTDPISREETQNQTEKLIDNLQIYQTGGVTINLPPPTQPLPPASFQRFLREANVSGVVLTDHEGKYGNKFYNSRFDTADILEYDSDENSTDSALAKELTALATTISRALYMLARPGATDVETINANYTIVNEMLYCFLVKANCRLLRSALTADSAKLLSNTTYPAYVSVFSSTQRSLNTVIHRLVGYFTGNLTWSDAPADCQDKDGDQIYQYMFMQGPDPEEGMGYCAETNVNLSPALSPAFINGQEDWASTKYSTWTESRWGTNTFTARVYLKPSTAQESVIFCLGLAVLLTSLLVSYFFNARASILFSSL